MSTLLGISLNGRYRLQARIGSGGMSTVYRAQDETLQRVVAVKLMNREVASDSDQLERFRREARAVAQLSHPHIVGVIDAGEDEGRPYIVFECVAGETLKERIRRAGRLPAAEAVAYAIEIARALGAAHARHIVHRDVKPQNVLIDEEGSAKVTDFGIARSLDEEGLTDDGRVLGTTDYVAPEQALGRPVTGQSDLYSLGVVLYEMLTGEVPFKGDNQVAVAMKHVREQLPDLQSKRPEISAALAAVVDRATAKRPEDRYANDAELIADLEDVLAIESARAGAVTGEVTAVLRTLPAQAQRRVPFRIRHRVIAVVLLLVALGVVGGGAAWLVTRAHHGPGPLPASLIQPSAALQPVSLCQSCAHGFNPLGNPLDEAPNASLAIDNAPNTYWDTQLYFDHKLEKAGTGLYVDASPGLVAKQLRIIDATRGFTVTIYARSDPPPETAAPPSGWTQVSAS
ncbi:MAG TPA: protein kinase, partial [Solirubrobacteraceae bacterium]|nr:protein kinase [Solirubrobacteraceae bacterium]